MKYSLTLLALGAASISALAFPAPNAQSSSSCDVVSLAECAQPLTQQVLDCGEQDLGCVCNAVSDLIGCYDNFCPGEAPAEIDDAIAACNSEGQNVADPSGGTEDSTATFANGLEESTSTGLGRDDLASETTSAAGADETETETLVDPESTETSTAKVTKTTSAADDSEETTSAELEQNDSTAEDPAAPATTTRTQNGGGTQTRPAPTQTGAGENLVAPVGGLLAAAIGVVALL